MLGGALQDGVIKKDLLPILNQLKEKKTGLSLIDDSGLIDDLLDPGGAESLFVEKPGSDLHDLVSFQVGACAGGLPGHGNISRADRPVGQYLF